MHQRTFSKNMKETPRHNGKFIFTIKLLLALINLVHYIYVLYTGEITFLRSAKSLWWSPVLIILLKVDFSFDLEVLMYSINRSTFHWMLLLDGSSKWGKRGTNLMKQATRWSLVWKQRCWYFFWSTQFQSSSSYIFTRLMIGVCCIDQLDVLFSYDIETGEWTFKIYCLM